MSCQIVGRVLSGKAVGLGRGREDRDSPPTRLSPAIQETGLQSWGSLPPVFSLPWVIQTPPRSASARRGRHAWATCWSASWDIPARFKDWGNVLTPWFGAVRGRGAVHSVRGHACLVSCRTTRRRVISEGGSQCTPFSMSALGVCQALLSRQAFQQPCEMGRAATEAQRVQVSGP